MENCGCFARIRNYNEQCRAGACSRRYLYMKLSEKFRSLPEGYVPQCGKMSRSDKRDGLPSGAVERSETEGVKIGYIKPCENSPSHFFCEKTTALPSCGTRFCLCGLERRTKSTAAPTDAPFIRHRRRSHMLPEDGAEALIKFDMKCGLERRINKHRLPLTRELSFFIFEK